MTGKDIAVFEKLLKKYDDAQMKNDSAAMLEYANEIAARVQQFSVDKLSQEARCTALLRLGDAYCALRRFDLAIKAFDEIFREIPDENCKLIACHRKILMCIILNRLSDAEVSVQHAYELLDRARKKDSCRIDKNRQNILLNHHSEIVHAHGFILHHKKQFTAEEKLYLQFLSRFKNENEFRNVIKNAVLFYYNVSQVYHSLKSPKMELHYLNLCLSSNSDDKIYFTEVHLRLAAFSLRERNYEKALQYCNQALSAKKDRMNIANQRQFHSLLQNAKAKIYEAMKRQSDAEKILSKQEYQLNPEQKKYLNWILFDF